MDVQKIIEDKLSSIAQEMGIKAVPSVEMPVSIEHGDFTTNLALVASKELGKAPIAIASEMVEKLTTKGMAGIEKIDVAKPGFINFHLAQSYLVDYLQTVLKPQEKRTGFLSGKKIMVEFTDANPFKELHIGHLYSNIVGESTSRILEANGAEVIRVCYQGDVGLHVAKSLWGMQQKLREMGMALEDLADKPLPERVKFLGAAYALGAEFYETDAQAKEEIIELNKMIYAKDNKIMQLYTTGKQWSLEAFDKQYQRLGTKFARLFFESEVADTGLEFVKKHLEDIFQESQGAIIFPGEKYGFHSRVFINSLGLPTYEAKELGLAILKNEWMAVDQSIVVTANEINDYFKVVMAALNEIHPELVKKTKHLTHGVVKLPEGKMSSRRGNVLTASWMLDTAKEIAEEKIAEETESETLDREEKQDISEKVGTGAVKYALLKNSIGRDITFHFDESISFEGNAGPYLQYTYVRTRSLLEKGNHGGLDLPQDLTLNAEEFALLRLLAKYFDIVESAAKKYSPHLIANYLYELAQAYNLFYQKHQILKAKEDVKVFRLILSDAVGKTMKDGLCLLGIQSPERM